MFEKNKILLFKEPKPEEILIYYFCFFKVYSYIFKKSEIKMLLFIKKEDLYKCCKFYAYNK